MSEADAADTLDMDHFSTRQPCRRCGGKRVFLNSTVATRRRNFAYRYCAGCCLNLTNDRRRRRKRRLT